MTTSDVHRHAEDQSAEASDDQAASRSMRHDRRPTSARSLATTIHALLGLDDIAVKSFDGGRAGPTDAAATIVIRSRDALARVVQRPSELGVVRAFVAGDLDVEGDLFSVLELGFSQDVRLTASVLTHLLRAADLQSLKPITPPAEEIALRGHLHSRRRDAAAISHHYDVSNDFYELLLGPSMTYSCALFNEPTDSLEKAQARKYELICAKLGLCPGMRLLDVGCGWGGMVLHAARNHGVTAVGVTISRRQFEYASRRVAEAGLADRIEIRLEDYREIRRGPFDAISSIGMFEHVGRSQLATYFHHLFELLTPNGRLLNHGIARPGEHEQPTPVGRCRASARRVATALGASWGSRIESPLMKRYVFPDGELHEVGVVISVMQEAGFEAQHMESLRWHYSLTLRQWLSNLEDNWDEAVRLVGPGRAQVWRLYLAASALSFEHNSCSVFQVLATRSDATTPVPLRPDWTESR